MTVLIVEDEIKTAKELKKTIEKLVPDVSVVAILESVKSAITWFGENEAPDLVFSDIQLGDGLSFEIYKRIDMTSPIIFCTAFDEYAIEAFKTNGIDYLLKPIDEDKLNQSLEKFQRMKTLFGDTNFDLDKQKNNIQALLQQFTSNYKKTILVHFQDKIIPLKTESIAYVQYDLGNVYVITFENKRYIINQTLDEFETILNPDDFFRANRQFIVNKNAIITIESYFSRRMLLKLTIPTSEAIIVSKVKSPQILRWVENT